MALVVAPERGRHLRPWEENSWDKRAKEKAGVSFLEKLAVRHHPSDNHHSNNSEMQVDLGTTIQQIYTILLASDHVVTNNSIPKESGVEEFNQWYYGKGIEELVEGNNGFFGRVKGYIGNAIGTGLHYAGNAMDKAFSILPAPVQRYGLAGSLSTLLYLAIMACNGQATPTPINTPTPSPTAAATATPTQEPTSNPAVKYALDNGLLHLVQELTALGQDGKLDENEIQLIDYLKFIDSSLIPQGIIPYYSKQEITTYQQKLIGSVLSDNKVSDLEAAALKYLNGFNRWNVQRDIIYSGMIGDEPLQENWDGDTLKTGEPLTNITELSQGTNPLNGLETDSGNLSERYAVIAAFSNVFQSPEDPSILIPTDLIAHDALEFYHLLKKNGYDDDHIILFLYRIDQNLKDIGPGLPIPKPISEIVAPLRTRILPDDDPLWEGDNEWAGKNLLSDLGPVKIDYDTNNVTTLNFLNAISSLPTDNNDDIFMYYASHGVGTSTPGEGAIAFTAGPGELDTYWNGFKLYDIFMRHYLLNKAIQNIGAYGRLVIMQDGCNTGAVLKDLDKTDANQDYRDGVQPSPIRDTLALSATLPDESQSGVGFGHYFLNLLRKDPYLSVSRAVRGADIIEDNSLDATVEHSIMYPFGIRGSWPTWISIVGYSKMEKP